MESRNPGNVENEILCDTLFEKFLPKLIDIYVPMEKLSFTCTLKSDYTIQALLMETNHSIIESFGLGLGLESFMT